jgi:hypothetical protein
MAKRSSRSSPVVTIVLIVIALAAMAFVLVRQQSKDEEPRAADNASDAEFASLLGQSEGLTYHAVYDVAGAMVPDDGSIQVEVFRDGDRVRIVQTVKDGDRELVSSVHKDADGARSCVSKKAGEWTCADVAPGSLPSLGDQVIARLERSSGLAASRGSAMTRDTRCFATDDAQACFDDRAVPVRFRAGDNEQILADVQVGDDAVSDDDFAEPT